jgi:hypothetical protein
MCKVKLHHYTKVQKTNSTSVCSYLLIWFLIYCLSLFFFRVAIKKGEYTVVRNEEHNLISVTGMAYTIFTTAG